MYFIIIKLTTCGCYSFACRDPVGHNYRVLSPRNINLYTVIKVTKRQYSVCYSIVSINNNRIFNTTVLFKNGYLLLLFICIT